MIRHTHTHKPYIKIYKWKSTLFIFNDALNTFFINVYIGITSSFSQDIYLFQCLNISLSLNVYLFLSVRR